MKGFIFTEFLQMVEEKFGYIVVDKLVSHPDIASKGIYTGVGNYPFSEMQLMLGMLHTQTQIPIPDLLFTYGRWLFQHLADRYPYLMEGIENSFELFEQLDRKIHDEIKKLYPESAPPRILTETISAHEMHLVYQSHRKLGILAIGLIHGCADYFKETLEVTSIAQSEDLTQETFLIKKV